MPRDLVAPLVSPSLESLLETPEHFRAWLRSLPPERLLNAECGAWNCPLDVFLLEHGIPACVGVTSAYLDGNEHPLPEWATRFVIGIDTDSTRCWCKVTASVALRLLDPGQQT